MQLDEADPKSADRASLARALADLEAAKARVERDAKNVLTDTRKQLVSELLPVLDNVDRAIAAAPPEAVAGMQLVRRQLEGVLRGYGVERIDSLGQPFDPQLHDAIATLPVSDAEQHRSVIDQVEPGYRFGDALLRPAKVVVGALEKPAPAPEQIELAPDEPDVAMPRLDPRFFCQPERVVRPLHGPHSPFRSRHRW